MERLNQLRQSFLLRIVQKVAKVNAADVDAAPLSPTKREVEFLEKNLEELSRAHMQVCVCVGVRVFMCVVCVYVCVCVWVYVYEWICQIVIWNLIKAIIYQSASW